MFYIQEVEEGRHDHNTRYRRYKMAQIKHLKVKNKILERKSALVWINTRLHFVGEKSVA